MIGVENLSVLLTQIVPQHLLVEIRNVLTPVIVHEMLIARLEITEVYANVDQAILETRMESLVLLVRNYLYGSTVLDT